MNSGVVSSIILRYEEVLLSLDFLRFDPSISRDWVGVSMISSAFFFGVGTYSNWFSTMVFRAVVDLVDLGDLLNDLYFFKSGDFYWNLQGDAYPSDFGRSKRLSEKLTKDSSSSSTSILP